jgi:hypothetical protein
MKEKTLRWVFGVTAALTILIIVTLANAGDFVLTGPGRDTALTSMERSVAPDKDFKIVITGNHPYRSESKGKFYLYKEKRQKIKEIRFVLQPGETKSWEFPADEKINLVNLGVYGKGEIKVVLQQDAQSATQTTAETEPIKSEQDPPTSADSIQSSGVISGSFALLLKDAEKSYLDGNNLEAVEKLKQAVIDIWNQVPLTVKNVRFVEDTKTYVTRKNNIFGSGEKIHINGQIFGYKLNRVGEAYSINITTDMYFLQGDEILAGQQDFGKFNFISPIPSTEFRLDLTYWFTDAPAGTYDVQTVLHDQNSGQSTTFTVQIEME